jgi:hypothetical protein
MAKYRVTITINVDEPHYPLTEATGMVEAVAKELRERINGLGENEKTAPAFSFELADTYTKATVKVEPKR